MAAEQALFVKGQNLYNQSLYHEGIAVFGDFLSVYPQSQIKDLALLWLGRCNIKIGDVGAAERISLLLREIPDTQLVGLYEEELRVARQSYVKARTQPTNREYPSGAFAPLTGTSAAAMPPVSAAIPPGANADSKAGVFRQATPNESIKPTPGMVAKVSLPIPPTKASSPTSHPLQKTVNTEPLVRILVDRNPRENPVNGVMFYRLLVINEGKGVARNLSVSELLPADLEFASSDPAPSRQEPVGRSQRLTFQTFELRSGTSRALRIAVRLRAGTGAEAILKAKHSVSYQDSDGKSYLSN